METAEDDNKRGGFGGLRLQALLGRFWPAPVRVNAAERWRAVAGAAVGVLFTALVSRWLAGPGAAGPWLVAPLGASAVLVFAVPASPLAQPWAVIGGNTLSALVGTACALYIGDPAWAGAAAVGLAIGVMFGLRCLHPPGGATALFAVLAHTSSYEFAAFPMLANSVLLVLAGVAYNSLTGRRYPHGQQAAPAAPADARSRFSAADLDAALAHYNQVLDVSRDDLEALLHEAELAAYRRNLGDLRCGDIMSREPLAVSFGTPLAEAWGLMRQRRIKALPVTDRARRVVGIVTVADFMRQADLDSHQGLGERLRAFVRRTGASHSDKPEVVGQIMTRQVRVASAQRHVIELVPLFSEGGHHHIPIIDEDKRLVGIITQSDLVRALYRAVNPGG
ncbi:HPP family protein [Aquincola sp. MAHUQ-54]|uniref:HPP family protein n=1 Tax=Aquincola agrisoli TaxID=3119538 RepID=A0AAW9Q7V1_9BURK